MANFVQKMTLKKDLETKKIKLKPEKILRNQSETNIMDIFCPIRDLIFKTVLCIFEDKLRLYAFESLK